jgi:NAD(P)-dependent dehydrogenase (short-subunit alcohol dehydrogenase family)
MTDLRLEHTVALVTGAAGGIGRAVVRALNEAGAHVLATDLAAAATIEGAADYYAHDVTREADWARIAGLIRARHGRLDALVNAAAVVAVASIEATSLEHWRRIQAVNVESMLIGTKALLGLMRESGRARPGGASIVNFSSVGGLRGAAFTAAYCTSKGAVKLLTKSAAIEFATLGYNIRVNSIHPGGIHTDMLDSMMQAYADLGAAPDVATVAAGIAARHPLQRCGTPEEIGGGVVYLCSPAASFVTGSELVIDGGFSAI